MNSYRHRAGGGSHGIGMRPSGEDFVVVRWLLLALCLCGFMGTLAAQTNLGPITTTTQDDVGMATAPSNPPAGRCRRYFNTVSGQETWINSAGATCGPSGGGGGSMTWPGAAGIPNYGGSLAWGSSYNSGNPIPNSFLQIFITPNTFTALQTLGAGLNVTAGTVNTFPANASAAGGFDSFLSGTPSSQNAVNWRAEGPYGGSAVSQTSTMALVFGNSGTIAFPRLHFSWNGGGDNTVPSLSDSISGNAGTASAFAGVPIACSGAGQFATGIASNGDAICPTTNFFTLPVQGSGTVSSSTFGNFGFTSAGFWYSVNAGSVIFPNSSYPTLFQQDSTGGSSSSTLEQMGGATTQTSRIYHSYTSSTNFSRLQFTWDATNAAWQIGSNAGSGGGTVGSVEVATGSTPTARWSFSALGSFNLSPLTDNAYDIGCVAAGGFSPCSSTFNFRPRNLYLGSNLYAGGSLVPAFFGFGNQAACLMDNAVHLSTEDCATYMEVTLGLRSGYIFSRPEIMTRNPFVVNYVPDLKLSTGPVNSTVCDDSTLPVTAWSITGGVVTFTATNTLKVGATVQIAGFGTSTFFNGIMVTVLAAGLSGSQFEANFAHANGSATEAGTFTPNLNCTIIEKPWILGGSASIIGQGPVLSAGNMSSGSLIKSGDNGWFPPVGKPTEGTMTCSGTGGPGSATYHMAVQFDVDMESNPTRGATRGFSAYTTQDVTCAAGSTTINVPAPTGGIGGSLAHPEFSVGVASALNGDYYVQQAGTGMTCGVAGVIDSLNDCKTTGIATIAIASIQTASTSFPMAADNKTGQPFDITNAGILFGPNQPVSFLEQLRDLAVACPPTGHGVNSPNVMIVNMSGQEGAGSNNGTLQMYGDCGGYSGISGAFILDLSQTPNSTWSQLSLSGGPTSGATAFYGIALDGRGNGVGGASGTSREMNNVTIALKGGGTNSIPILAQGFRTKLGLSNFHGESINGNESVYVTNGAHFAGFNIEGSTTGSAFHFSNTAGFSTIEGACPQGIATASQERCQPTATAILDDGDTTGTEPILGYVAHWASGGSKSQLGNLDLTGPLNLNTNNITGVGNLTASGTGSFGGALVGLSIPAGTATFAVGTGITSVACASGYSCNNSRGTLTIVGGTATTGTIATVSFSAALSAAPACFAFMNGGASAFGIGNGIPSTTSFTISSAISVLGATFNVNYECRP